MKSRSFTALCGALVAFVLVIQAPGLAQMRKPTGVSAITAADMKEWLSYIASDQLQGRQVYTEGLGLAASYIAEHLKEWGVKPAGDDGTYFQVVKVLGVNVKRGSTRDRHRQRTDEDVQGRRRRHVSSQSGRQADDHRHRRIRRLRPQPA